MNTSTVVLHRCLQVSAIPMLGTIGLATTAGMLLGPGKEVTTQPDLAKVVLAPYLHLPCFVAVASCACAAAATWPPMTRGRDGTELARRMSGPPLFGCGSAVLGASLAMAAWLLPITLCLWLLAPQPHVHVRPAATNGTLLTAQTPELQFESPPMQARELRLRPLAVLLPGASTEPMTVAVTLDGETLTQTVEFVQTQQLMRIALADHEASRMTLRRKAGELPLLFSPGSIELVQSHPRSTLANAAITTATWWLAGMVTLALVLLLGWQLSLPVVLTLIVTSLVVQSIGQLGPATHAMAQTLRGRWLLSVDLLWRCAPSMAVIAVAWTLARLARRAQR